MAKYRLGIRDEEANGIIFWYDQESYEDALYGWHLLNEYGRDGIQVGVQEQTPEGHWVTIYGASLPNITVGFVANDTR